MMIIISQTLHNTPLGSSRNGGQLRSLDMSRVACVLTQANPLAIISVLEVRIVLLDCLTLLMP